MYNKYANYILMICLIVLNQSQYILHKHLPIELTFRSDDLTRSKELQLQRRITPAFTVTPTTEPAT